jgi:RHS repeat-associated protein
MPPPRRAATATLEYAYVGLTDTIARIVDGSSSTYHATDVGGTELYEWTDNGPITYVGTNGHGDLTWSATPAAITAGTTSAHADYDPFGNLVEGAGSLPAARWQGSLYDAASGLYYVVARWYSPSLGRFVSTDPMAHLVDPHTMASDLATRVSTDVSTGNWDDLSYMAGDQAFWYLVSYGGAKALSVGPRSIPGEVPVDEPAGLQKTEGPLYINGSQTASNLTPRLTDTNGLSSWDTPEAAGITKKGVCIDAACLGDGGLGAYWEPGDPLGHWNIRPVEPDGMNAWLKSRALGGQDPVSPFTQFLRRVSQIFKPGK